MAHFYQDQYRTELALHQKYAQSPVLLDLVWTHSCVLGDICLQLLNTALFDTSQLSRELVFKACLLHDIGTYACEGWEWLPGQPAVGRPYIQHMIIGAWILMKEGYPAPIIQAAYAHKATGLTKADIAKFGMEIPSDEYLPQTLLQQLICYASKFHSKAPKFRELDEILKALERYGPEKVAQFTSWYEMFGPVQLAPLQEKYQAWDQAVGSQLQQFQIETGHLVV